MKNTILDNQIDISSLLRASNMLSEAIEQAQSPLEKTGAIQCFEYCYELSWKTMKRILKFKGVSIANPRDTFREAAKNQLISDPEVWFSFILKRNMTSHAYNGDLAEEVFEFLPEFQKELLKFIATITGW